MSDRPVAEVLKEALALNATRVIDLFKTWDEDQDGTVSKKEFRRAVAMLGLKPEPSRQDIDALFDEWDPDGSGAIDYKELNKILRKGTEGLDPNLQAGAAGTIETSRDNAFALRKGGPGEASRVHFDIDEDSDKTVAEQLRDALSQASVRVIDLFHDWDDDQSGTVSRAEFHKAMKELQFSVPVSEVDALFTSWDPDGSGALELKELEKLLRRGSSVKLDAKLQAGAMGEIETSSKSKYALRKGGPVEASSLKFDIDEDSDKTVAEQLRDALSKSAVRVIDLFRDWDDDQSGTVSRAEFHKAMKELQFSVPVSEVDALFTSWDPDGSGALELKELEKLLRRGADVKIDAKLQAGAMGEIETSSKSKYALRKGPSGMRGSALSHIDIDEDSDKSVAEQMRDILSKNAVRVIDLFREWDEDGDGTVSKKEFRKAMPLLGLDFAKKEIDALFDSWDPDGSGALELREIEKQLRRGGEVQLDDKLKAGGAGKIETSTKSKFALRKGVSQRGTALAKIDLDEDSDLSVAEQLRDHLSQHAVRVIDLFREWDEDGDGTVSKKEFRKAMPLLGLEVPKKEVDALFDSWDPDGSGSLEMREIEKQLRRGADVQLDSRLQAGVGDFGTIRTTRTEELREKFRRSRMSAAKRPRKKVVDSGPPPVVTHNEELRASLLQLQSRRDAQAREALIAQWRRGALSIQEFVQMGHLQGIGIDELLRLCRKVVPVPPKLAASMVLTASPRTTRIACNLRVLPQLASEPKAVSCRVRVQPPRPDLALPPISPRWPPLVPGEPARPEEARPSTRGRKTEERSQRMISRVMEQREARLETLRLGREQRTSTLKQTYGSSWRGSDLEDTQQQEAATPEKVRHDRAAKRIQRVAQRWLRRVQAKRKRDIGAVCVIQRCFKSWKWRLMGLASALERQVKWRGSAIVIQAHARGFLVRSELRKMQLQIGLMQIHKNLEALDRMKFDMESNSARVVEQAWARHLERKNKADRFMIALTSIQRQWRGHLARRRARELKRERAARRGAKGGSRRLNRASTQHVPMVPAGRPAQLTRRRTSANMRAPSRS